MKRWGKSLPRLWQHKRHGKPRLEQGQVSGERHPLDKDAAGRPLEIPSDRDPREMIVETIQFVRQNPAYRLIAQKYEAARHRGWRAAALFSQHLSHKKATRKLPHTQSTNLNGITKHRYEAESLHPSGSNVAARSGALKVNFTSSVGI